MVLVAKASDIAKRIASPPQGTLVGMIFGKIFEQLYVSKNHVTPRDLDPFILRIFTYDLKSLLELHKIYSEDLLRKGIKMYIALHEAKVVGVGIPPTFRRYENGIYIAAQPDLYSPYLDKYFEFKTYPIDEYAKKQAEIFAWVLQHPITLVGLREASDGYEVETMVIEPKPLNIDPEIVRSVAREQYIDPIRYIPPHRLFRRNEPDEDEKRVEREIALEA
ncbi:MAG: hypothetical protein QXI22_06725 [Sulfolobales archaeon]